MKFCGIVGWIFGGFVFCGQPKWFGSVRQLLDVLFDVLSFGYFSNACVDHLEPKLWRVDAVKCLRICGTRVRFRDRNNFPLLLHCERFFFEPNSYAIGSEMHCYSATSALMCKTFNLEICSVQNPQGLIWFKMARIAFQLHFVEWIAKAWEGLMASVNELFKTVFRSFRLPGKQKSCFASEVTFWFRARMQRTAHSSAPLLN